MNKKRKKKDSYAVSKKKISSYSRILHLTICSRVILERNPNFEKDQAMINHVQFGFHHIGPIASSNWHICFSNRNVKAISKGHALIIII